ncbi:MAG: hypothetical protein QOH43_919 [Solirubrobacteraceae bacterium]|jgi:hypothetical protein|nr:hypothetical protein [Solirubrobacteraceae bacterium]
MSHTEMAPAQAREGQGLDFKLGEHEARTGQEDPAWPDWHAEYMVRERAGEELPS